jgi:hypothetical protein
LTNSGLSNSLIQPFRRFLVFSEMYLSRFWRIITGQGSSLKIPALLVALSLIYVLTSYRGSGLTIGGDGLIPFHPIDYIKRLSYATDPWAGFGSNLPPIFSLPPLPEILVFSVLDLLRFDIYMANKLYLFILATCTTFSVYYLGTTIFHDSKKVRLIGIASAISYLYNPWVMADTYKSMVFLQLSFAQSGLILFLAFSIMFFRKRKIRYSLFSGLITFLLLSTPGLGAYFYGLLALCGYLCIALYSMYLSREHLSIIAKGSLITFALGFILNSYWLIPFLTSLNLYVSFAANFQTRTVFNNASIMLNTLRLMNAWGFSQYVPYSTPYFSNPLLEILTFSWPLFAFSPLLIKRVRNSRKVLVIYLILLFAILLACGSNPPLGSLYSEIVNVHLGSFYIMKPFYTTATVSRDVLTPMYAIMIGLFSSLVYSKLKSSSKSKLFPWLGVIGMLLVLMLSTWPIVTGEVMRNWYAPDQYGVRIPDSYWEASEYLEKISDASHRTLVLPPTQVYIGTTWGYQGTSQFYGLMLDVPTVTGNEIPYGVNSNKTLMNEVYSMYYTVSDVNNTFNVLKHTDKIRAWQNDRTNLTDMSLYTDFNNTSQVDKWHQVELRLDFVSTWSNFTHMVLQLRTKLCLDRLQIGIEDTDGYVGWWLAEKYLFQSNNGTFAVRQLSTLIGQNNETITLLINLEKPDRSRYSIEHVRSVVLQYFVTNSSDIATLQVTKMQVAKMTFDTLYYARFLEYNKIEYLLVDMAIKDGAKSDPKIWLDMLSNSRYFKLIWQKDTLSLFENTV